MPKLYKSERRERKQRKRKYGMRVSGGSVRLLAEIMAREPVGSGERLSSAISGFDSRTGRQLVGD